MAQITFDPANAEDVDLVEAVLARRRQQLNGSAVLHELLGIGEAALRAANGESGDGVLADLAEQMVRTLWGRCGEKSRQHIHAIAVLAERDGSFTIESLAEEVSESYEAARRWRHGFGRSLKKIGEDLPDAPPLFDREWDHVKGHNVYTVRPEV